MLLLRHHVSPLPHIGIHIADHETIDILVFDSVFSSINEIHAIHQHPHLIYYLVSIGFISLYLLQWKLLSCFKS
ncbi:hypothetical protein ASPSYDRAFT_1075745 [Aspergillus sydowii CBS 593.65]|uniref:Uncharacterized protein n=1 Tax=Aspergillus sydowii CBS 593.65 TaxID=1036612 RepID=A0A1L9TE59_9EURO|nr:uncharacterized protein ASPSYDRAFT_1075745 [Aspergillus sydowii CBS 593.65]OJJ57714.1 hypothetical protein ASPSYDRAFT_1075745 [Aspergillus sydowii CBS 593.65]